MANDENLKETILELPAALLAVKNALKENALKFSDKMKMAKTTDGKELHYDGELKTGIDIFVMEGTEKKAAPDGEYQVELSKLTVKGGKIIDVKTEEPVAAVDYAAQMKAQKADFDSQLQTAIDGFKKEISDIKAANKAQFEGQNKILQETFDLITAMSKLPQMESQFKKRDGAAGAGEATKKNVFEEAAELSKRVFKN